MTPRLSELITYFDTLKLDAVLVTDSTNIFYLTGLKSSDSWLLVLRNKTYYITDSRYDLEVAGPLQALGIATTLHKGSIIKEAISLTRRHRVKALGIDEQQWSVAMYRRLKSLIPAGMRLRSADLLVEHLRMVKDVAEVQAIRESLKVDRQAYSYIERRIESGRTERDLLKDLEGFIRRKGVEFAFDPIIASGPRSAMPHATVTERKLVRGEPLLIDMGILKDGYRSDLTRMFFLGRMTRSFKQVLFCVREAQEEAFRHIRPGVEATVVDQAARRCLKKHGLARYFGHSLGHGVGLDIHEMPRIAHRSGAILQKNMVFTVEPGVYLPGRFGIRLEEMVLVTDNGCEVL